MREDYGRIGDLPLRRQSERATAEAGGGRRSERAAGGVEGGCQQGGDGYRGE